MIRASAYGRLGSDPAQRETRGGKTMVTTTLAVNVAKPGDDPVTEWVNLVGFGTVGELLARHAKGDLITVMGPMTKSTFTARDGEERSNWGLLVESILSARTARNERPRERRNTSPSTRSRSTRSLYSAPRQSRRTSVPDLPGDRVDDLYAQDLVP
jgi:single-strand DNA-binding protein